ncbi:MAG: MBL fold metallo-hydrolase [Candidatus Thorarchaeota archaeon]|nr:MBL fold metallo-hydrolase [Candidatus Thorarchaeota archaeon]
MSLVNKTRVIALIAILGGAAVGSAVLVTQFWPLDSSGDTIKLTILDNAGVMIEADGLRIYIDPIGLPSNYSALPADAVLITHPHGDHYNSTIIEMLQKESTVNVMPSNMSAEVALHDATGVVPGDSLVVGSITIRAFYMYTIAPEGYEASHPPEANWTSYLIDYKGFTIFHAGDSKNINEYTQLAGTIDVALLPLGPGCQSMADGEVVDAIDKLQARNFLPIHTTNYGAENFILFYQDDILEVVPDCYPFHLDHFTSHTFEL